MEIKVFIAERFWNEISTISRIDKSSELPYENTTLSQLYEDGWRLVSISPMHPCSNNEDHIEFEQCMEDKDSAVPRYFIAVEHP